MATFLSQNNLADKTVIPFCTHDGYGVGRAFQAIKDYCPKANVLSGFDMLGSNARNAKAALQDWLKTLGIKFDQKAQGLNSSATTPISIVIGNKKFDALLNDAQTGLEFKKLLPINIPMVRYGNREYYGILPTQLATTQTGKLDFEDGDITFCPQNNSVAIFFAQSNQPNLPMEVIPIGNSLPDLRNF